ncbi:hypothetical protein P175DRAFT_0431108 [Aspergillus ochraceoroseus IBT 24754]|uniref:Transcription initiation factor TFIID subunit 4 n=3 Tax=Aspergillus subgen. Nidulantes TaxID=2720870 RepID=A0A0F8UI61_9EURO|nr:uncharacterized protein P175DRAFT_0431108 [Aspergillus ochraceoroseus IBT 24754]KKK16980.1 hypothetical protein AOCH_003042 [Aspergillus ochraceoroseus]KKK19203.1 hypothetical protein ARAM_004782 [Aspergillus rambellii]PTU22802.1 hypothetical protein P175DRAFT_0431108 [Aspergillus ochraceoroseus IBT 24754]
MAQTQPQQFSQSFSPPGPSPSPGPSPVNGSGVPPKRQHLSPLPQSSQSPYVSPSFGTLQLPQTQPVVMNGTNVNGIPQTPAPPPPGTMGPPSRPVEKATDAAELTDVLASSGIDVREEEAYLTSSYSAPGVQAQQPPRPQQQPPQQQPPPLNTSFTSQTSNTGTISSTPSFSEPSQFKPSGTQESIYTEPSTQPPAPFKDPNEPTREDSEAARRAQYHLQEPFLLTKVLEQRLQRRGFELGVRIPAEGLFHPVPGRPQPIEVTGPDGSSVVRTGQTILNQEGAPLVDILNLMSISCEERLRTVIDYSSTLAQSRRAHSHGTVPIEWKDLASSADEVNGKVDGPQTPSLKRPHPETQQSIARSISEKYRLLVDKDVSNEEARAAKRAKRSASAILGEGGTTRSESVDIPGSGASTPIGERAPSMDKKGLSKKEARKLIDAKANEAQQHQQSVETARMATNSMLSGSRFGSKKTYSWLNRGPAAGSGFSTPTRVNTAAPSTTTEKPSRPGEPTNVPTKRLGVWREDKEKGAGIQVRDILFMLELDGRGSRHIQKAYSKDLKEDRID